MKVSIGVSNRHVHLTKEDVEILFGKDLDKSKVVVVGGKGISYIKKYGMHSFSEYIDIPDLPTSKEVNKIYNDAIYLYEKGDVSEVNIVYTEFISPVKQEVKSIRVLPLEKNTDLNLEFIIEQSGRDHIILSDPATGKWYLLLMIYVNFVEFDEPINTIGQFYPSKR